MSLGDLAAEIRDETDADASLIDEAIFLLVAGTGVELLRHMGEAETWIRLRQ